MKSSIARGPDFHLFRNYEGRDDSVYLELDGVDFTVTEQSLTVGIPARIWEVIRHYQYADFSWVDKPDNEIADHVESFITERIEQVMGDRKKNISFGLLDAGIYGSVNDPASEQIERGVKYYQEKCEKQQKLRADIKALKGSNPAP